MSPNYLHTYLIVHTLLNLLSEMFFAYQVQVSKLCPSHQYGFRKSGYQKSFPASTHYQIARIGEYLGVPFEQLIE